MRLLIAMTTQSLAMTVFFGCSKRPEKTGLAYSGETRAEDARLLIDETWVDTNMQRAREAFGRWWSNPEGRIYTVGYETYADCSLRRRIRAWWMETTGMGTF